MRRIILMFVSLLALYQKQIAKVRTIYKLWHTDRENFIHNVQRVNVMLTASPYVCEMRARARESILIEKFHFICSYNEIYVYKSLSTEISMV